MYHGALQISFSHNFPGLSFPGQNVKGKEIKLDSILHGAITFRKSMQFAKPINENATNFKEK